MMPLVSSPPPITAPRPIPTVIVQQGNQQAIAPDWANLSFAALPPLGAGVSLGNQFWAAGTPIDQILTLGDFQSNLRLQDLNLSAIFEATRTDPSTVSLNQFPLLRQQTLANLVDQIPSLGQRTASEIPPIAQLLRSAKLEYQLQQATPLSLLVKDPMLGSLTLNNLDLTHFTMLDIPGLLEAPLQTFDGWGTVRIADVPQLNRYPWNFLPGRLPVGGAIGVVKLLTQPLVDATSGGSISGSTATAFQSPCTNSQGCFGIEFSSPTDLQGRRWFSGIDQWVEGGDTQGQPLWGTLEPTGRLPYGSAFKVVITEVTPQSAQTALYFRHCEIADAGSTICSPYTIGPVNFLTLHPGDAIGLGELPVSLPADAPLPTHTIPSETEPSHANWLDQAMQWVDGIIPPQVKSFLLCWLPA